MDKNLKNFSTKDLELELDLRKEHLENIKRSKKVEDSKNILSKLKNVTYLKSSIKETNGISDFLYEKYFKLKDSKYHTIHYYDGILALHIEEFLIINTKIEDSGFKFKSHGIDTGGFETIKNIDIWNNSFFIISEIEYNKKKEEINNILNK